MLVDPKGLTLGFVQVNCNPGIVANKVILLGFNPCITVQSFANQAKCPTTAEQEQTWALRPFCHAGRSDSATLTNV